MKEGEVDLSARRARGAQVYARLFGVREDEVLEVMADRVGRAFAEEAFVAYGGPGWHSPALTARDRSIAVLTALVSQGVGGDRLSTHLQLAIDNGLDEDALTALITLVGTYAGLPRASAAMEAVRSAISLHSAPGHDPQHPTRFPDRSSEARAGEQ